MNGMKQKLETFDESEHRRQKLERENQDLAAELDKLSLIQVSSLKMIHFDLDSSGLLTCTPRGLFTSMLSNIVQNRLLCYWSGSL